MKRIIYVADLHLSEKEPYKTATINVLKYLLEHYKDDIIIQGGDLFDSSRHSHDFVYEVTQLLLQFSDIRLLQGNHDQSYALGSILKSLKHHKNITVYKDIIKEEINDINFQIIPYQYGDLKEKCESIAEECDYSLSHIMPIQEAFNNEGIELKFKANVAHIFAHVHRYREFKDNFGNPCLIAGISSMHRHGEQDWENNIYELQKDKFIKIPIPKFMDIKTIQYGDKVSDKNVLYNVENAPDMNSVYEMYKDFYIRREGVTYKQSEEKNFKNFSLDNNLITGWTDCAEEEGMDTDIFNEGIKQIERYQGEKDEK
jgi:hypothetical protein